jgi:MoaA/NifB/PqqE/SkfB family radical SAM enzyme
MEHQRDRIAWKIGRNVKKAILGSKNLILRATSEALKPTTVIFEVTDRCNSRCQHCNIWRKESTKVVLTAEEIENTFSDELFRGVGYVIITGGEVALRHDLEEVVLRMHRVLPQARLQLSTNGLLPDQIIQVVKAATKNDISLDVGISLDGIGEAHDHVRGVKGNFEEANRLIHELIALRESRGEKLGIAAGIVLSDLTLHSLEEVRAYARELGIGLTEAWYNESPFYDNISGTHSFSNEMVAAVKSQPISPLQEKWLKALNGEPIRFSCFAMYTYLFLRCNGDIQPCLGVNLTTGNVKESSPTSIWHSSDAQKARKMVKDCQGCLNSWGASWSFSSSYYPHLLFHLRHPRVLMDKLKEE